MSSARTPAWYLRRPRLDPEFARVVRRYSTGTSAATVTRASAERWCAERAVVTGQPRESLAGTVDGGVRDHVPEVFKKADETVANCPVKMGGAGNLDLLYWLAQCSAARSAVETGVTFDWSALALLLSMARRDGSQLGSTDMPGLNRDDDPHVGGVVPDDMGDNIAFMQFSEEVGISPTVVQTLSNEGPGYVGVLVHD